MEAILLVGLLLWGLAFWIISGLKGLLLWGLAFWIISGLKGLARNS